MSKRIYDPVTTAKVSINNLKKLDVFPFYTKQALADRWQVNRQTVNNWAARHGDFCRPVENLIKGGGPYYPLMEVMRYENERGLKIYE